MPHSSQRRQLRSSTRRDAFRGSDLQDASSPANVTMLVAGFGDRPKKHYLIYRPSKDISECLRHLLQHYRLWYGLFFVIIFMITRRT
jgi:hypothetical protein